MSSFRMFRKSHRKCSCKARVMLDQNQITSTFPQELEFHFLLAISTHCSSLVIRQQRLPTKFWSFNSLRFGSSCFSCQNVVAATAAFVRSWARRYRCLLPEIVVLNKIALQNKI